MLTPISRCLRLISILLCLLVSASFVLFAIHDTSVASAHQQDVLSSGVPPGMPLPGSGVPVSPQPSKGSVRHTIDELAEAATSPFSAITDRWSSEWLRRSVLLLLALFVYGFGLSFLARMIRVRL